MDYLSKRKIFYFLSGTMIVLSLVALLVWGLNWGIDFRGGTLWEISIPQVTNENILTISSYLKQQGLKEVNVQRGGNDSIIFRCSAMSEEQHQQILQSLKKQIPNLKEKRFDSIGPSIGQELKKKAIWAVILVFLGILIYLSYAFRKASFRIPSYRYGVVAVLALLHDTIAVVGLFVLLGKFAGWEVNSDFVVALLVVAGYSVHDTIVIFDRTRENILLGAKKNLKDIMNLSVSQTILRSLNTSLTTIFPLIALYFLGPLSVRVLVLAMIWGTIVGTYSSLFIAPPLLYDWQERK